MGNNSSFNGSTKYINGMLSASVALMVAAICGMWGMYGKVEALSVEVKDLHNTIDMIVTGKIRIP